MSTVHIINTFLRLPNLENRKQFITSTFLDSLASGIVFAFLLLYFDAVTDVSLANIGLAMTFGRSIALVTPWIAGKLLDSAGSISTIIIGNFISVTGIIFAVFANNFWLIFISQILVQAGTNFYWTSSRSVVSLAAGNEDLPRWFALLGALRNIGTGIGSICAAIALQMGNELSLRIFVAFTALFFAGASYFLLGWKRKYSVQEFNLDTESSTKNETLNGNLQLLSKNYIYLLIGNFFFVLISMALPFMYPIWAINILSLPASMVGIFIALNTAIVAIFSTSIVGRIKIKKISSILLLAGFTNVIAFIPLNIYSDSSLIKILFITGSIIIYSVAEIISTPYLSDLSIKLANLNSEGIHQGAFQFTWSLGMAAAPALYGFLFTQNIFIMSICLIIMSLLASIISSYSAKGLLQ